MQATGENETFQHVAEYMYSWSMGQGWFQFPKDQKMLGGKTVRNRNGTFALKPKTKTSLMRSQRPLKDYDDKQ